MVKWATNNVALGENLGNTRESFGTKNGIAYQYQRDDYYPFGMEANSYVYSTKNQYLYNKKEQQPEFNEYDFGASFYDPVIARWTSIDPLAEKSRRWSNYNYVMDNPIRLIDPDGMFARIPCESSVGETDEDVDPASDLDKKNWAAETAKAADKNADYHVEPDHWAEAEAASNSTTSTATGNSGTAAGVVNSPSPAPGDANQGGVCSQFCLCYKRWKCRSKKTNRSIAHRVYIRDRPRTEFILW
jgi:RHS repeat-associated protein